MFKKALKKTALFMTALILVSQLSFLAGTAEGAGPASLSLGDATLRNGCPGSIPIRIDTGGEKIWASDVALNVTGNATADSLALGSILPMQACNDTTLPEIMLCGARQAGTGAYEGAGVYGTINVTPKATGTLSFSFVNGTTNIINEDIQDVLGTATGKSYNVATRFNVEVDGVGFCNPDTTAPTITVSPSNGKNNVPVDTSIVLTLSDDRVGVDLSTLKFTVAGVKVDTFSYTKTGGTYKPATPFDLGEKVDVAVSVCDLEKNCRDYAGSFRTTPPEPPASCGDKIVNEGEDCDMGRQTATCDRDCTFVACGDGTINDVAGEQCDDFNIVNGDGCSSTCALETPVKDQTYCPSYSSGATYTCTTIEGATVITTEGGPVGVPGQPGGTEVAEEGETRVGGEFEQADFEEAANESVTEAELRPAAESVILPTTAEKQEAIDPCILRYGTEGATLDHDGDGLSDRTECYSETDPNNKDTDGDSCLDGEEINRFYTDPLVADCSISDYVEAEVLIVDPKPNWILTSLEVSGSAPRRSLTVGVTAFPAIQKTFSKVLTQYEELLNVLKRDVDPANVVAAQQKVGDTTDAIAALQESVGATQTFIEDYSDNYTDLSAELEKVQTFLDSGAAAVATELDKAEEIFDELQGFRTKSIFLGEVTELQTVGIGDTTTAGFKLEVRKELEDGVYDLVATAGFEDGGTRSSDPVRIQLSSDIEVEAPIPQTLDGFAIGAEKITTENRRPVVRGKTKYGNMVFATWNSLVLESSIIADSAEGVFNVQPPRDLEPDADHTVVMYAVTETPNGLLRSKSTSVDFSVAASKDSSIYYYTIGTALFLFLAGGLNFALGRVGRRKRQQ